MPKEPIQSFSQEEYIQAIHENQRGVLAALYTEVFPKVRYFVLQNSGDEDQAKDIFQDAFIVVWQQVKLKKFTPQNPSALQGFLYQICKNKWLDWLRSSKFKKEVSIEPFVNGFIEEEKGDLFEEKIILVKEAFTRLGQSCRDLLKSFYFNKESLQDLAVKNGWTPETAKNNKYRCMEKLRKSIHQ